MAADPRQFTEHNEVGGVNVYLEDKRMSELKSATGKTASQISTADEYIPLQDTDGNLVKINPASFQEAVRNVLGSLLANNDKGTTISGIPALSGSGASLDFGSVTPANLASVLGVDKWTKRFSSSLNTPLDTGLSVNAGYGGQTLLALAADFSTSGDATYSKMSLLRLGYDGGHLQEEVIASCKGSAYSGSAVTYTVSSNNTLVINGYHPVVRLIICK